MLYVCLEGIVLARMEGVNEAWGRVLSSSGRVLPRLVADLFLACAPFPRHTMRTISGQYSDRIFAVRAHYLNTAKIIEIAAITTATMAILSRYTQVVCGI